MLCELGLHGKFNDPFWEKICDLERGEEEKNPPKIRATLLLLEGQGHGTHVVFCYRDEVEKLFESKELDVDGRLSFEEFMGEQSRAERLFKLMDKDGDGFVTKNVSFSW